MRKNTSMIPLIRMLVLIFIVTSLGMTQRTMSASAAVETGNSSGNLINLGFIAQKGDWIYYRNLADYGRLYKVKKDGTGITRLNYDQTSNINVVGDYIYYVSPDPQLGSGSDSLLYKIKTDGTGKTKVTNEAVTSCIVVGDWIYYTAVSNDGETSIYKIKTNGSSRTRLNNDDADCISISGDWIYYQNLSDGYKLYKMKFDGTGKTKVSNVIINNFTPIINGKFIVSGDWIYFVKWDDWSADILYKVKTDGSGLTKLSDRNIESFNLSGDWIYFMSQNKLYKVNVSGKSEASVVDLNAFGLGDISIIDDWIYYESESGNLYKVKTDGTQQASFWRTTLVREIKDINVSVYQGSSYTLPSKVKAIMTDGTLQDVSVIWKTNKVDTQKTGTYNFKGTVTGLDREVSLTLKVLPKASISKIDSFNITINKGDKYRLPATVTAFMSDGSKQQVPVSWNPGGIDSNKIGTFTLNGTVKGYNGAFTLKIMVVQPAEVRGNSMTNIANLGLIAEKAGWYYYAENRSGSLYKVKADGTEKTMLTDGYIMYINIVGDWIYYADAADDYKIYKIKLDGTGRAKVCDDWTSKINVVGDWIYYIRDLDGCIYKVKVDGSNKTKLTDGKVTNYYASANTVYYVDSSTKTLYSMKADGSNKIKVLASATDFFINGDYVYYKQPNNSLFKAKLDGNGSTKIIDKVEGRMNMFGDNIFFTDGEYSGKNIYSVNTNGTGKVTLVSDSTLSINIIGDWIYYSYKNEPYKMKADGSQKQKLDWMMN